MNCNGLTITDSRFLSRSLKGSNGDEQDATSSMERLHRNCKFAARATDRECLRRVFRDCFELEGKDSAEERDFREARAAMEQMGLETTEHLSEKVAFVAENLRNGMPVVVSGSPKSGKSSLIKAAASLARLKMETPIFVKTYKESQLYGSFHKGVWRDGILSYLLR